MGKKVRAKLRLGKGNGMVGAGHGWGHCLFLIISKNCITPYGINLAKSMPRPCLKIAFLKLEACLNFVPIAPKQFAQSVFASTNKPCPNLAPVMPRAPTMPRPCLNDAPRISVSHPNLPQDLRYKMSPNCRVSITINISVLQASPRARKGRARGQV